MKTLYLADYKGLEPLELKERIAQDYRIDLQYLILPEILVAYQHEGSWGCDSSAFFLFKRDNKFFEVHASHCSCYGFEGQWEPEETTLEYLKSEKFSFGTGDSDTEHGVHLAAVKEFLQTL